MASSSWHPRRHRPAGRGALLAYVAGWLALGALAAATVIWLLPDDRPDTLPPLQQTELADAARGAGCRLRRGSQTRGAVPAVEGPPGTPARVGSYDRAAPPAALVAAMRRGAVVIHYRPGLDADDLRALERLRETVPRATILTPNARMPYRLAATAWRRLLGCPSLGRPTVDAIRLFRGRYVGQGPDA